ncbi:MAG: hypothetical protein GY764_06245, partial [Halieaceae bacterium]|nr:hypothetical protein [Halieaceae bacterium]
SFATDDFITGGSATLSSTGGSGATVTITGETASTRIEIGDSTAGVAGALSLSEAELQDVDNTFAEIIVGFDSTQSGTIEVEESGGLQNLNTGLRLRGEAGDIDIDSAINLSSTAGADFAIEGQGNTTLLSGDITTAGGTITINDSVLVDGARVLDSGNGGTAATAGSITITGDIGSVDTVGDTLTLNATGSTTHGAVDVQGNVGTGTVNGSPANALNGFTITQSSQVDLANVSTTGAQSITGTNIDLNGTSYQSDDGNIAFNGAVDLDAGSAISINSDADSDGTDGNISFSSTIDGAQSLALAADTGTVTLSGVVGGTTALSSLTVTSASQVDLANVSTTGAQSITGTNIDLNGTSYTSSTGALSFTGAVDLDAGAATTTVTSGGGSGDNITFSSTIDDASNDTALILDAGSAGNVTLSGEVGGTNRIGAFTLSNANDASLQAVSTNNANILAGTNANTRLGGTLTLNGDLDSGTGAAGSISLNADNIRLNASGTGTITLDTDGTSDGAIDLATDTGGGGTLASSTAWEDGITLNAGTATVDFSNATLSDLDHLDVTASSGTLGDITLGDGAGNSNVGLDINTTGDLTLNGDVSTAGDSSNNAGIIDLSGVGGDIILANGGSSDATVVTITTDASGTDATLTLGPVLDGGSDIGLTLDAGVADVTTSSTIGTGANPIGAFVATGNDININGNVEATSISLTAVEGGDADSIDITGVTLDANGGNMSFATDDFITGGSATLSSTGGSGATVTITGETASTRIEIGDSTAGVA